MPPVSTRRPNLSINLTSNFCMSQGPKYFLSGLVLFASPLKITLLSSGPVRDIRAKVVDGTTSLDDDETKFEDEFCWKSLIDKKKVGCERPDCCKKK